MKPTFTLAAPSLYPAGTESAMAVFAQAVYPFTVRLINHMPRRMTLTLLGSQENVFLEHCAGIPETTQAIVTLTCVEQLARLVWQIEQISELNRYRQAITIEALGALPDETPVEVSTKLASVTAPLSNEKPANDTVVTDTTNPPKPLPNISSQDEQVVASISYSDSCQETKSLISKSPSTADSRAKTERRVRSVPAKGRPTADGSLPVPAEPRAGAPPPPAPATSTKRKNSKGANSPNPKGASP
ncbi:hypothetical protein HZU77_016655 [Neisseriaceae bacterium TC5R-5]|nr:hypothetical protein [Neisseriaceae bacterium TC5R-5]